VADNSSPGFLTKRILSIVLAITSIFVTAAISQEKADFSSIDALIRALYTSLTFPEGQKPDLDRFRSLFIPEAPFIRITKDGVNKWNCDGFIGSFTERIQTGTLKSFQESEIFRKTNAYGSIAQVFSTYKKGINTKDPASFVCGINSLQFYFDGQRWWIISIAWEDERPDNPISKEYLGKI
jgi:hypothetical protein